MNRIEKEVKLGHVFCPYKYIGILPGLQNILVKVRDLYLCTLPPFLWIQCKTAFLTSQLLATKDFVSVSRSLMVCSSWVLDGSRRYFVGSSWFSQSGLLKDVHKPPPCSHSCADESLSSTWRWLYITVVFETLWGYSIGSLKLVLVHM